MHQHIQAYLKKKYYNNIFACIILHRTNVIHKRQRQTHYDGTHNSIFNCIARYCHIHSKCFKGIEI